MFPAWHETHAHNVAQAFLEQIHLTELHPRLVSFRQTAVFHLAGNQLALRVYRPGTEPVRASTMVRVARWLEAQDFPAARLCGLVNEQPLRILDCDVSLWHWLAEAPKDAPHPNDPHEFGRLLRRFHELDRIFDSPLGAFDPLAKIRDRLEMLARERKIGNDRLCILETAFERVAERPARLHDTRLGTGIIHGDALPGNAVRTRAGLALLDFDSACIGPREWDLVPTWIAAKRLLNDDRVWIDFLNGYGAGMSDLADLEGLCVVKQLSMIVYLCLSAGRSAEIDREIDSRLLAWHRSDFATPWRSVFRVV